MLLIKLAVTVTCITFLITMAYVMYYILFDKDFASKTTPFVQASIATFGGTFIGCMLTVIYNVLTGMWLT